MKIFDLISIVSIFSFSMWFHDGRYKMCSRLKSRSSLNVQRMCFVLFFLFFFHSLCSSVSLKIHACVRNEKEEEEEKGGENKWETKIFVANQVLIMTLTNTLAYTYRKTCCWKHELMTEKRKKTFGDLIHGTHFDMMMILPLFCTNLFGIKANTIGKTWVCNCF